MFMNTIFMDSKHTKKPVYFLLFCNSLNIFCHYQNTLAYFTIGQLSHRRIRTPLFNIMNMKKRKGYVRQWVA